MRPAGDFRLYVPESCRVISLLVGLILCFGPSVALAQSGLQLRPGEQALFQITNGTPDVIGCWQTNIGVNCTNKIVSTFTQRGTQQGTRGLHLNTRGLLGGVASAFMGAVLDAAMKEMMKPGPQLQNITPQQQTTASQSLNSAIQQALQQQQLFQAAREQQLLAAMSDVAAYQLMDSSINMRLETQSDWTGLGFDTPLPGSDGDTLWMKVQDIWYSPEQTSNLTQADGARPVVINDQPLQYSNATNSPLQCIGGHLCAFPAEGPAVSIQPIATESTTGGVPLAGDVPQILGLGAPAPTVFENQNFIIAAASCPPTGTDMTEILTTTFIKKGSLLLPPVQGAVAGVAAEAVQRYMLNIVNDVFAMLRGEKTSEDVFEGAKDGLADSVGDSVTGGSIWTKAMTNHAEDALQELIERISNDLRDVPKNLLKNQMSAAIANYLSSSSEEASEWVKQGAQESLDAVDKLGSEFKTEVSDKFARTAEDVHKRVHHWLVTYAQ